MLYANNITIPMIINIDIKNKTNINPLLNELRFNVNNKWMNICTFVFGYLCFYGYFHDQHDNLPI
jgi:hypothetical protein